MTRITPPSIRARKADARKIVTLTAYTAPVAKILDAHADILLVGDSVGMTVYGMDNTLGVSLEMMIAHGRAVARASSQALVVIDMPFATYQQSPGQAFASAARIMQETGAGAVKLEGGAEMAETIAFLVERGIPVMAHIGLLPQHVHSLGGFKMQGKDAKSREKILDDAKAIDASGAFACVIESTEESVAREATGIMSIPTIGIGASKACDGQVLVIDDVIGLTERPPKFAHAYGDARGLVEEAAKAFAEEVRLGRFPKG